jgi:hypothetical protein
MGHAITLDLPNRLYEHYFNRAQSSQRRVEAELLDVVAAATDEDELPPDLQEALEELTSFGDEKLWEVARQRLPAETSAELEGLNFKQQDQGLDAAEKVRVQTLLHEYEKTMLLRAEAAGLLTRRGHDVSVLLTTS